MSHYKDESVAASIMRPVEILDPPPVSGDYVVSPKLDGVFARWIPRRGLYSKRGILFQRRLIPHIYAALEASISELEFDGEIWAPQFMLADIASMISHERLNMDPRADTLTYNVFDTPLPHMPYFRRHMRCIDNIASNVTSVVPCHPYAGVDNINRVHSIDGLIFRARLGIYKPGPCSNVQKLKFWKDVEGDVIRVNLGYKHEPSFIQSLTCRLPSGALVDVGTGFTMDQRATFSTHAPARIKIKYLQLSAEGVPLNPSYRGEDV